MNDQPSRKKARAKYAPKACVACRRSKLKCSGENPCLRCLDNGRGCFYSEDQTAAEALQNLSRPTPGNGASRRNTAPRNEATDRRASDASVLGLSMEARMARIEGMMETLIHERHVGTPPRGSIETEDALVDGCNGEAMAQANMDAFAARLVPVRPPPPAFPPSAAHHLQRQHSLPAANVFARAEDAPTVRHGGRDLHFPDSVDHQRYLNAFFWDLNTYYPSVNETIFRSQNEIMLEPTTIDDDSTCQLALNYIIFACVDVLGDTTRSGLRGRPAGWQWFQLADDLIDKRKFSGRGDLSLIQCLILQALYLMFADQPDAAYTTIGLTCRLCYRFGLHQESPQTDYTPFQRQLRQRIFWIVYIVDARISLSCARPYSIQSANLATPRPKDMYDFYPEPNVTLSPSERIPDLSSMFLSCMTFWPRLASNAWDNLYAAGRKKQDTTAEALDTQIKGHMEATLSFVPFLVKSSTGNTLPEQTLNLRRYVVVLTSYTSLRLLLYRPSMTSLTFDAKTGRHCGILAVQIVQNVAKVVPESPISSKDSRSQVSEPLGAAKFHITTALASALLTLCALILSDLHSLGLVDYMDSWINTFRDGAKMLHALSLDYVLAARVARDFDRADMVIACTLNGMSLSQAIEENGSLRNLLPYRTMEAEDPDRERHVGDGGWNDELQIYAPGKGVLWL